MKKSTKYLFADFTTKNYAHILDIAKERYTFRNFSSFIGNGKFILWRHDVDFSMHRAKKIAQLEKSKNIKSTYFILLHSEFYNLLEKEIFKSVKYILNLGHEIGLHFDHQFYNIQSTGLLNRYLTFEKKFLEELFGIKISTFSFHITNPFVMQCDEESYAGMINCSSKYLKEEVDYCSDSNGYWRFNRLEDMLLRDSAKPIQVLTHPELWQDEVMSPRKRVWRSIEGRAKKTKHWYNQILKQHERKNIG